MKNMLSGESLIGGKHQQFYGFAFTRESARDVYSKRRIIIVIELQIIEWHDYKHLDWITMRRDDDKLYKFKEGSFTRLRIQDIEDMLLLLAIWRKSDKERAAAMIQAIDKQLKTRRIIRSLEKFIGRRLVGGLCWGRWGRRWVSSGSGGDGLEKRGEVMYVVAGK
nr:hypothetical protein [Tanacetum cinerariifolium]